VQKLKAPKNNEEELAARFAKLSGGKNFSSSSTSSHVSPSQIVGIDELSEEDQIQVSSSAVVCMFIVQHF
jgi:hypothetical protein